MNKNFAERPFTRIELRQVMSEIMPLLENEAILQDIMLQYEEPSGEAVFMGDNEEFKQVILNIVKNAFEATGPGGSVHVYVREKDEMLDVAIEDDGCGIPEEIMDQVLTPFFTTKADGTGLGLSICQKIINSFGGRLEIESRPGRTVVHILLPKASSKHNDD
jgi:signal transduction histidine kinase